jgi:pimeloyl-ACP methyl ester carboxylesterase
MMDAVHGVSGRTLHGLRSMKLREVADLAALLRWLGPWAGDAIPPGVTRTTRAPGGLERAYLYEPQGRAPGGAYLVAPGLHFLGPDDPRLDRFCRVLAASGALVMAPFLPDFLRLELAPTTASHLAAAFDDLDVMAGERRLPRPAIFSISFGSMPAIEIAARPTHRDRVGALVVFGGFADFDATVRFAVTGVTERGGRRLELARDPLNSPAVFLNLLPHLDAGEGRAALEAAWRRMVRETWGRMELKAEGARDPYANRIAEALPPELRELFLVGCGLRPGAIDRVDAGLRAAGDHFGFFDPRPHLARLAAPVYLLHGRDDDVIPWFESEKIRDALPAGHPHRLHVVGMASHTGVGMPPLGELARELATLLATAQAMVEAPRRTGRSGDGMVGARRNH